MRKKEEEKFKLANRIRDELFASIKKAIAQKGLSQGDVAKRIDAERYNVNKLLRGQYLPTIDFLLKVAEGIGLEVDLRVKELKEGGRHRAQKIGKND